MQLLSLLPFIHLLNKIIFLIMQLCLSPILLSVSHVKYINSLLYFWKLENTNDTEVKYRDYAKMQRLTEKYKTMKCSVGDFVFKIRVSLLLFLSPFLRVVFSLSSVHPSSFSFT